MKESCNFPSGLRWSQEPNNYEMDKIFDRDMSELTPKSVWGIEFQRLESEKFKFEKIYWKAG